MISVDRLVAAFVQCGGARDLACTVFTTAERNGSGCMLASSIRGPVECRTRFYLLNDLS
jgi:hypothetical protein